jgi:uncharacterized protein YdeI (YjbR/CyaY-like superfamily)
MLLPDVDGRRLEDRRRMVRYFKSAAAFRAWLDANHSTATELWVGIYKKDSGRGGLTYKEAVDQALCYGWIDGIAKGVDEVSYSQRFTPRKARSHWSSINRQRVAELCEQGLMAPAGLAAFAADDGEPAPYSHEQPLTLSPALLQRFKAQADAWQYFSGRPPGYRRSAAFWVMSAKKEETRERRFATLLADSAAGRPIKLLAPVPRRTSTS